MSKETIISYLISLFIGMSSAFLTAQVSLARLEERMAAVEKGQAEVKEGMALQEAKVSNNKDLMQTVKERTISVETKIDILLMQSNPRSKQ